MPYIVRPRRFPGGVVAACAALLVFGAASAQAATSPAKETSQCKEPTLTQPFQDAGDNNYYVLAPGQTPGNFEGTGWTLSGGASIKTTTLADGSTGYVLDLPSGSKAVSPSFCVTSLYPTERTPPTFPMSKATSTTDSTLEDLRSTRPVERLLEDSWKTRSRRVSRRELLVETAASTLFLVLAIPLALSALGSNQIDPLLAGGLMVLYALSCLIKFPIGAGYVVPSYMVLVPMLLLLPPGAVPLLTACSLVLGTLVLAAVRRAEPERVFFAISDAWHTLGPAAVLVAAGPFHGSVRLSPVLYAAAFLAGCVVDLVTATVRESAILGIRSRVQIRVIGVVWVIDACIAPLGLLVAYAAHRHHAGVLLLVPFNALLLLISRERTERIAQAQRRLDLIARERTRLQTAVRRLGEALAAKLDLEALTDIVLRGSVEALDADAGRLELRGLEQPRVVEIATSDRVAPALNAAVERTLANEDASQVERDGIWALSLPLGFSSDAGRARGALAVAREGRAFRDDEEDVMRGLVEQARQAATDIVAHQLLRKQALTDSLTKLGNRRKLQADLAERSENASESLPLVLILFDLDGFKNYND